MSSLPKLMPALNASRKPIVMNLIAENDALFLAAITVDRINDLLHFGFAQ